MLNVKKKLNRPVLERSKTEIEVHFIVCRRDRFKQYITEATNHLDRLIETQEGYLSIQKATIKNKHLGAGH